jgi:SAM-dependent methyltransferase
MAATTDVPVAPSNVEQLRAWDGDEGAYWATNAERFDRGIAAYRAPFLDAAAIRDTERILDVGCGTGQTTRDAGRAAGSGSVLGVDLSSRMLEYARRRAAEEHVTNVAFEQADAQVHPFAPADFDVAISRTAAMFFGDPVAALVNVRRALRPEGRLVLLTWQGPMPNEWIRELSGALAAGRERPLPPPDAPGPFALSDPDRIHAVLDEAGYSDVVIDPLSEPMWFGDDADDAQRFVVGLMGWMLDGLDDARRGRALDDLHRTLTAHETADGVVYESAVWTIRAGRGDAS